MMEIKHLPIKDILYDESNPRIKFINPFESEEGMQSEAIPSLLRSPSTGDGKSYSFENLKASIKGTGTIVTPIWVKKSEGRMVCIEGNTRLCVYRELFDDADTPEEKKKWTNIPAIVYENISIEEEHSLKLAAHVVGTRPWTPYSRANYVNELLRDTFSWDQIVEIVGGRKKDLQSIAIAQESFDKHYRNKFDEYDEKKFSYFVEAENRNTLDILNEHGLSADDFGQWVYDGKLKQAYNVRFLAQIFANEEAKKEFIKGDISDAMPHIVAQPDIDLNDVSESVLINELQKRIDALVENEDFHKNEELIQKFILLSSAIRDLLNNLSESDLENIGK